MSAERMTISLFGPFQVSLDGETVTEFSSDSARALLAYLVMYPGVDHRRDALAGLLWPETSNADALRNLRTTLSRLRDAIRDRDVDPPFLDITRRTIQFLDSPHCSTDVWTMHAALVATRKHDHARLEDCEACAKKLRSAVDLYRGEFLTGFTLNSADYEAWVLSERERLHWDVLEALRSLAAYHESHGDYDAAIVCARRQVELDPWREVAYRQWMGALALSGSRNAALAKFAACRSVLIDELGIEPEAATVALYEQIRDGAVAPASSVDTPQLVGSQPQLRVAVPDESASASVQGETQPIPWVSATEGELRTVTVIQAEITGTDALRASIGIEDWAVCLSQLMRAVEAEVVGLGGEPEHVLDSGLAAFFGADETHEDDPERGVLAALTMQPAFEAQLTRMAQEVPEWRDGLLELDLRVGIHTGETIVKRVGEAHSLGRLNVMGDAVLSTRRLLAQVPAGEVRVSEMTYRLVEPLFEWSSSRARMDGENTHRPVAHRLRSDKGRGIPGMRSSLVGRAAEFHALSGAVERLKSGIGSIVTLIGEAGIGKSRLVAEVRETAGSQVQWVEGRCLSYDGTTAYSLWTSALRGLLGTSPDTAPAVAGRVLLQHLRDLDGADGARGPADVSAGYPYLARLLGAPVGAVDRTALALMDAQDFQDAAFSATNRLLEHASHRKPLMVVCEDLHWADPTSLQLLERLLSLTDRAPLLLLCVFRPRREHGCWRIRETVLRAYPHRHIDLQLQPLTADDGEVLLRNLLLSAPSPDGQQTVDGVPQTLRDEILSRSEGNPFYVEEVLRSFILSGIVICAEDGCQWQAGRDVAEIGLPDTLYGVLGMRLDSLPAGARHVLQLAAIIGRIFPYRLLAEIADRRELDRHLVRLQREQLIREQSGGPKATYIFEHQLTCDATYHGLLHRERRALHRRVAEALERLYPERIEDYLGLLAYHWDQAGDAALAVEYLRQAGEQAAGQYANAEALQYLDRALQLTPSDDLLGTYALLRRCAAIYDRQGEREQQWAALTRLRRVVEQLDQGTLSDRGRQAEVAMAETSYYLSTYDQPALADAAQRSVVLARESGNREVEMEAQTAWGNAVYHLGDGAGAAVHWNDVLSLARSVGNRQQEAKALRRLAIVYGTPPDTTKRYLLRALSIHRETGNRAEEGKALTELANSAMHWQQPGAAKVYGEEGLHLCRTMGLRPAEGWALAQLAWALCNLGQYAASNVRSQEAIECFRQVVYPFGEAMMMVIRAWVAHELGDDALSCDYSERACHMADAIGALRPGIGGLIALGDALAALDRRPAALRAYEEARSRCRRLKWYRQLADVHAGLARLALAQGTPAEALGHVREILSQAESDARLTRTFHPTQAYFTCYRVLQAVGDPQAHDVLQTTYDLLQAWAAEIEDVDLRRSYLENVPTHRQIIAEHAGTL